ncbi:hypothetical protein [Lichenicola sp.]|uniref:hypothetical protein n=1 Tax=Lichenicola sp. TaxID=2804529 RepID=UPI003B00365A
MSKKHKAIEGEIVTASGPWRDLLLVCRKCSRKLDGGFGEKNKHALPDAMKQVLRDLGRRRDVRILEVGCLGLCPKDAVTVMHGAAPGEMLVVPEGLDLTLLVERIGQATLPGGLTRGAAARS